MSRETRTAQANQTGALERLQKFLVVVDDRRLYLFGYLLLAIGSDDDYLIDITDAGGHGGDGFYGTRYARVGSCAHKRIRRTNQLTYLYIVPFLYQRIARCAHVHMQGDVHLGRNRHSLRNTVIGVLVVRHVHTRQCLVTIVRHDFSPHFYNLPESFQTDSRSSLCAGTPCVSV
jgi:hypothetical protein